MNQERPALVIGCLAAALGGYWLAYQPTALVEKEGENLAIRRQAKDHRPAGESAHVEAPQGVLTRTTQQLEVLKKDLLERFATSTSPMVDWVLRGQAAALLATLSAEELEGFAREITSGDPQVSAWIDANQALQREIFKQWGLRDPAAACLGVGNSSFMWRRQAFDDWLKRDPEAAQTWLDGAIFPPGNEKEVTQLRQDFLKQQAATDFSKARESLAKLDPELQKKTLLDWSKLLALDPAKRGDLLAVVASRGDPDFTRQCYERVVREMAAKSPQEASQFLENTTLPDEEKHALSEQMLGEWASKDPQQAFAAWAALKEDQAPAPLLKAMTGWSTNSPGAEEAIEWAKQLDASPAREQFKAQLIENMGRVERYGQAAELVSTLDDPAERIRQMKIVKRQWEEKFPDSANQWYDKLPQADKDAMGMKVE